MLQMMIAERRRLGLQRRDVVLVLALALVLLVLVVVAVVVLVIRFSFFIPRTMLHGISRILRPPRCIIQIQDPIYLCSPRRPPPPPARLPCLNHGSFVTMRCAVSCNQRSTSARASCQRSFSSDLHFIMISWARFLIFPRGSIPSDTRDLRAYSKASFHCGMTGHERRTTVARRRGTSAASPPNPEGIGTDELGEGTSVPYSVSASLKLVDGVRDLDLERLPTPRAARSAAGHGGSASSGGVVWLRAAAAAGVR